MTPNCGDPSRPDPERHDLNCVLTQSSIAHVRRESLRTGGGVPRGVWPVKTAGQALSDEGELKAVSSWLRLPPGVHTS